jgi:hypothetical protein
MASSSTNLIKLFGFGSARLCSVQSGCCFHRTGYPSKCSFYNMNLILSYTLTVVTEKRKIRRRNVCVVSYFSIIVTLFAVKINNYNNNYTSKANLFLCLVNYAPRHEYAWGVKE